VEHHLHPCEQPYELFTAVKKFGNFVPQTTKKLAIFEH
jgi:hypothetical protein